MTTEPTNSLPHDEPTPIEPEPGRAPRAVAAELVIHGLLVFLHLRPPGAANPRVARVLEALHADVRPAPTQIHRFPARRLVRWGLAAAAVLAIGATIVFFGVPGESAALAEVRQTVQALRAGGDRRYEVRLLSWADASPPDRPNAIVDTRAPDKMVLRHTPPGYKDYVTVGRDANGTWGISPAGKIVRNPPRQYWPPFATVDGASLFDESIDGLLESLPRQYDLTRTLDAASDALPGRTFTLIRADRRTRTGHLPHHIDLYIDPQTRALERIEFRWDSEQRDNSDRGPDDRGPGDRGRGPGGPSGFGSDEPPPPPPDHDDRNGPGGPRGPRRPGGPDHDPGSVRGDGGPAGPNGPGGFGGPGGPKGDASTSRPGLPKLIIFQRVTPPDYPTDWFTPEGHLPTQPDPAKPAPTQP
ncbi:MAG: hypothetical protein ACREJO_11005 [Phycisphaerales bacterium]